jgi:hypothetical protein
MSDDVVEIIPRIQTRDIRNVVRGDEKSGAANVRILVTLETPGFAVDLGGTELAAQIAERIRDEISSNIRQGKDAQGRPLKPISHATSERRRRRRDQREDDTQAKRDRMKARGGRNRSKAYDTTDLFTPLAESGLFAENIDVRFKGTESGDPVFLIAFPSGGKDRGLVNDDGRGARLFAAQHYGFELLGDVPRQLDAEIDKAMEGHLGDVLARGGSIVQLISRTAAKAAQLAEAGADGESDL